MSKIEYTPDEWMLMSMLGTDPHYRIFGSWRGGYLTGDSWRMNSGITHFTIGDDGLYEFHGFSGSIYIVRPDTYGISSPWNAGVLNQYLQTGNGMIRIQENCPTKDELLEFDWIIRPPFFTPEEKDISNG